MRIIKEQAAGLVIDIQERLVTHMSGHEELIRNVEILIQGLTVLEVPLLLTEQYRKGLGETVSPVRDSVKRFEPLEKLSFSCCDDPHFMVKLNNLARKFVIICGIESHVCVLQTTTDLLEAGFLPVVISDCISSRKLQDKEIAIQRMRQEGAIISSYESILFELARVSGTDIFKAISRLVK
jgi:isochorismate hydrolase